MSLENQRVDMAQKELIAIGKEVLSMEADAIKHCAEILSEDFATAVDVIAQCKGKIIVTGIGKSGHIANKLAATLSSTGTPAMFLNPAESIHGDLGVIMKDDCAIAISKSGETREILSILPYIKRLGLPSIAITNDRQCTLSRSCDIALITDVGREACPMNLAPTTSTTTTLALGDALAVALMKRKGFTENDFAVLHPGGNLGRILTRVEEIMDSSHLPVVHGNDLLREILNTFVEHKNRGVAIITDDLGKVIGILVDGDLKRILLKDPAPLDKPVSQFMTKNPKVIGPHHFIGEALNIMENKITSLVVVDDSNKPIGLLHIHDILNAKII